VFGVPPEEQSRCFRVFVKEEEKRKDLAVWTVSAAAGPSRTSKYLFSVLICVEEI